MTQCGISVSPLLLLLTVFLFKCWCLHVLVVRAAVTEQRSE